MEKQFKCFVLGLAAVMIAPSECYSQPPATRALVDQETNPNVSYSGSYTIMSQPDSCGASACYYTITVFDSKGEIAAQFENTYAQVRTVADNIWEMDATDDFLFLLDDLPKAVGPHIALVICKEGTKLVDCTSAQRWPSIYSRRDELLNQTLACRATKSCMDDMQTKAQIVELAIYQVIMTSKGGHFELPANWLGGMDEKAYKALVIDIKAKNLGRMRGHVQF